MQVKFECENHIDFKINSWKSHYWYYQDSLHRENRPALIYSNGTKSWYKHGKKHRLDGPAYESPTGCKVYYIEGKAYSEQEFLKATNAIQIPMRKRY